MTLKLFQTVGYSMRALAQHFAHIPTMPYHHEIITKIKKEYSTTCGEISREQFINYYFTLKEQDSPII